MDANALKHDLVALRCGAYWWTPKETLTTSAGVELDDADHLAFLVEETDRGDADAIVDARTKVTLVTRGASERSTRRINKSDPLC